MEGSWHRPERPSVRICSDAQHFAQPARCLARGVAMSSTHHLSTLTPRSCDSDTYNAAVAVGQHHQAPAPSNTPCLHSNMASSMETRHHRGNAPTPLWCTGARRAKQRPPPAPAPSRQSARPVQCLSGQSGACLQGSLRGLAQRWPVSVGRRETAHARPARTGTRGTCIERAQAPLSVR